MFWNQNFTSFYMFLFSTASSKGQHEVTIPAGAPQYCFEGLSPDALYTATVFVQTPNLEGPGVSVDEKTCKCHMLHIRTETKVQGAGFFFEGFFFW